MVKKPSKRHYVLNQICLKNWFISSTYVLFNDEVSYRLKNIKKNDKTETNHIIYFCSLFFTMFLLTLVLVLLTLAIWLSFLLFQFQKRIIWRLTIFWIFDKRTAKRLTFFLLIDIAQTLLLFISLQRLLG